MTCAKDHSEVVVGGAEADFQKFLLRRHPHPDWLETKKHEYISVGGLQLNFQRTVRVPEGRMNSLPAGLGSFPVYKVADFRSGVPSEWRDGYFMPMYRQEAMWINFSRINAETPKALIVGAGNINAITGKPFDPSKEKGSSAASGLDVKLEQQQNYLVVPPQPWMDGWKAEDGKVYQFVAAEMGSGETVEGQITGEETVGGIQLIVYNPKPCQNLIHASRPHEYMESGSWGNLQMLNMRFRDARGFGSGISVGAMGLGRGGEISQKIYPDSYGVKVWEENPAAVEIVYLVSSADFRQVTGHDAPPTPITIGEYQRRGLPWFGLFDSRLGDSQGSEIFSKLKPVGGETVEKPSDGNTPGNLLDKLNPK